MVMITGVGGCHMLNGLLNARSGRHARMSKALRFFSDVLTVGVLSSSPHCCHIIGMLAGYD
jgi:hypothetical protein